MHPRRKIRDFVAAALDANQHIAPKIGVGRVIAIGAVKLPSIEVYTGPERVESLLAEVPRIERRVVDLRVALEVDATTAQRAQDVLDDMAEQITWSILEDETQGDVAERTLYRDSTPSAVADGDRNVVGLVIGFDVIYQFEQPARVLPDAEKITAGIDIESETVDQVEAQVDLDLET